MWIIFNGVMATSATFATEIEINSVWFTGEGCLITMGLYALGWQDLFGSSKTFEKNCLHQIFSLVIMGTLKNSKICVDHKVSMTWQDQRSKRDQHEIKTCLMFPLRLRGVNWKICLFSCLTKICLVLKQDAGTFLVWSGLTNYIGKKICAHSYHRLTDFSVK